MAKSAYISADARADYLLDFDSYQQQWSSTAGTLGANVAVLQSEQLLLQQLGRGVAAAARSRNSQMYISFVSIPFVTPVKLPCESRPTPHIQPSDLLVLAYQCTHVLVWLVRSRHTGMALA